MRLRRCTRRTGFSSSTALGEKNKKGRKGPFYFSGGEGGIRTPGTVSPYTRFPGEHLKPLSHLSVFVTPSALYAAADQDTVILPGARASAMPPATGISRYGCGVSRSSGVFRRLLDRLLVAPRIVARQVDLATAADTAARKLSKTVTTCLWLCGFASGACLQARTRHRRTHLVMVLLAELGQRQAHMRRNQAHLTNGPFHRESDSTRQTAPCSTAASDRRSLSPHRFRRHWQAGKVPPLPPAPRCR